MDRLQVIGSLQRHKKLNNYLEIGVFNGHVFFRIKSLFKVAVDPDFQFNFFRKLVKTLLNPYNLFNRYFQKTSDDFFTEDAPGLFKDKKIQISLVDGMHEYKYAFRDVENVLGYTQEDAVILIHDCNPLTKAAEVSYEDWKARNFEGVWNGNVWKAILCLRSFRRDLDVFVLDEDHGIGIVTKGTREKRLSLTDQEIEGLSYEDLDKNRKEWLNLKPASYFYEYFGIKLT